MTPARPDGPRVLALAHRAPYPPDKGDRIRNYHVLRELARHAAVDLIALADEPVPAESKAALRALCGKVALLPSGRARWLGAAASFARGRSLTEGLFRHAGVARTIAEWARETPYDAAIVSTSGLAHALDHPALTKARRVVDLVDVDSQKWLDFAAATPGLKGRIYRREGTRLRRFEARLADSADGVCLVSPHETHVYDSFTRPGAATVARNGVDLNYYAPTETPLTPHLSLVFVGAMDYLPNVDAVAWFVAEVWPGVRSARPDASFTIVGRKPTPAVLALAGVPGVRVAGGVPDVRPYLAEAWVAAVPMRLARGLQNKVLEAMAAGKPVVASPKALAALDVERGADVTEADTAGEWVAAVGELAADAELRRQLGQSARAFAERHHRWDRCLAPLVGLVLGAPKSAGAA